MNTRCDLELSMFCVVAAVCLFYYPFCRIFRDYSNEVTTSSVAPSK